MFVLKAPYAADASCQKACERLEIVQQLVPHGDGVLPQSNLVQDACQWLPGYSVALTKGVTFCTVCIALLSVTHTVRNAMVLCLNIDGHLSTAVVSVSSAHHTRLDWRLKHAHLPQSHCHQLG